jgi:hypothetical protein
LKGDLIHIGNLLIGGFLFIPEQRELTPQQVLTAAVQHFDIDLTQANASVFDEEKYEWLDIPATQVVQTGQGGIDGRFRSSHHVTMSVKIVGERYLACLVGAEEYELRHEPEETELFIEQWIELCEDVQADYAYFGRFEFMVEVEYLYESELPILQQWDVVKLFREGGHWLYYFGRDLVSTLEDGWFERHKEESPDFFKELSWRWLPSGALFVRFGKVYFP